MLQQALLDRERLADIQNVASRVRQTVAACAIANAAQRVQVEHGPMLNDGSNLVNLHIAISPATPGCALIAVASAVAYFRIAA